MAIFEPVGSNRWQPTALAAGPFAGLQGGAVAGLLTAEVELGGPAAMGHGDRIVGLVPAADPMTVLRTGLSVVAEGGRVSVIDNTLWPDGEDQPCATVRVTLSRERAVEVCPQATPPIPPSFRRAQGRRRMAGPGSLRPWRPARVTAWPGFA
jgi:hypothetical protein